MDVENQGPGIHMAGVDPVTGPVHGPCRCTGQGEKWSVIDKSGLLQLTSLPQACSGA